MGYREVSNNYLRNQVMGASPDKLIVMLYEAAIKSLKIAQVAIDQQQVSLAHQQLIKAQKILNELKSDLNREIESSLPSDLTKLYDYCYEQLVQANLKKDRSLIDEPINILSELLDAWKNLKV
ncbi:MAG: flagellar export chaperone FliS [Liquorilactobacillus nagelii]|jgi:flagellar protein FliS|uniref:flagellar export chaperone FliS n=1 Tax=Liquorilactobacillus nagelii TaxID=82688 RepID=UPI00242F4B15|nr:flagellar export chaperone FliS [Liquorilactobacillus nagelii]MCI1920819.1 flagellar export chaperone FliS [Liquorilactobacillus nagelii]MCI1976849.1 flagellar export chaperone FliS [Liquorilactobacillus nagelii]